MKKMNSLKNLVWMAMIFVAMFVSVSIVSCGELDDDQEVASVRFTVDNDTIEKHDTVTKKDTTTVVIREREEIVGKINADTLVIDWYKYHNDSIVDSDETKIKFNASIKREKDEVMTTTNRLNNLEFSFGEAKNTQNGKMQYVSSQTGNDDDSQNYTVEMLSEKIANFHGLENVHFILNSAKSKGFSNEDRTPKANESVRVKSTMKWNASVSVVGVPNLAGQSFEYALNTTNHERYILKNAPELLKTDTTMVRRPDVWFTNWDLIIKETWSNDSVAEKKKTVRTDASVSAITLEDKFVSSFDYTYTNNDLAWGAWKAIQSNDNSISLEEQEGTKLGNASNGYSADAFDTKYVAKRQRATVLFGGYTWNIPAEKVTLSTTRKVFVDQTSDLNGYSMVKFTNDEVARYNETNDKTLTESCKLYLKIAEPEIIDYILVDGSDYKTRTDNSVKVGLTIKPKYDNGTFGKEMSFSMERAESWIWKGDSVIFENVDFFMQETASKLELVGNLKKTAKTQRDNGGVFSFNEYEGDFRTKVTSNGMTKYTTWHAVWSEDFTFSYTDENGKTFSHTFNKSDYSVKAQDDKLRKNESKSSATYEVYDYSVDGIFAIDNVTRSAYGYGRFTKAIAEEVITEGWDKFTFQTDAKEYVDRVEYFLKWIREYNTGKKTSQDVKIVLKRNAEGSNYTITVEDPERVIGTQSEETSLLARSESASDIVISYDWLTSKFELPNVFDGNKTEKDIATFVDPTNVKVTKKNSKGEEVTIELPSFEHTLTSTVSDLQKVSETEELVSYTYTRTWSWASSQCTSTAKSYGNINKVPEYGGGEPDFDIEVGKVIATVSRPSNRKGVNGDITAYTYLLVSKDGKKCVPFGIYHDVITAGQITDWSDNVYGTGKSFNSACYVKDANEVVPTYSVAEGGFVKWYGANGIIDAAKEITLQGAGFNDRGNDCINHTGKYAPRVEKQGNVVKVTFSDTNVSYTFKGWDVQ